MKVLIYLDEGVGRYAFRQLYASLSLELDHSTYSIQPVDHRYLIKENWEEKTVLLVIPGGRDIFYHSILKGAGNKRISSFVSKGGSYLGLCAGGYYGSAYIEFEKGGELEVCASRELAFFPGRAVGPAYGLGRFCYKSEKGAREALVKWKGGLSRIYFNGGCYFEEPEAHPSIEVLARYQDLPEKPAALIKCKVGKGRAVLSGTHPEFKLNYRLETQRRAYWKYLLAQLLINL
ncbi:MAG: hypothetical protein JJU12_07210 [Chlamydiales bacterium]|nr:hypothetical protein [Chlamydiales bacterium]